MNRKQAKMLNRMRATPEERRAWDKLSKEEKGRMCKAFHDCPWMMYPSYAQTLGMAGIK